MTRLSVADYKRALKGAGPKLLEGVLERATEDPNIGFSEFVELCDYAYDQWSERRQNHGAEE